MRGSDLSGAIRNRLEILTVVAIVSVGLGLWLFSSKMQADTYNRLTGSNLTTWEAMWIQVRLDCNS